MNANIELQEYIRQKKKLYNSLLDFLENQDEIECNIHYLFENYNFIDNDKEIKHELKILLFLILRISDNHRRTPLFDQKINQIIIFFEKAIKQTFSNSEIFSIFKDNKRVLLFLFQNEIIIIDDSILNYLLKNKTVCHFFYPEIESHHTENQKTEIKNELLSIDSDIFTNFEEKRQIGENDTFICSLIRQDSIFEFVSFVNRTEIPLSSKIKKSIFETNSFLIDKEPTLIEYATFYGSIQIFNYLKNSIIDLNENLWFYAIHSKSSKMIHLIEENVTLIKDKEKLVEESIKSHHNFFVDYFENNYFNELQNLNSFAFHYCNFFYLSEDYIDQTFLNNACKYDHFPFVKLYVNTIKENDIENDRYFGVLKK